MKILSVYDSKADAYLPLFTSPTHGTAIRAFEGAVNQEGHQFQQNAADYTLFSLGDFDEQTGKITLEKAQINLGVASQFLSNGDQ